jgi:hypothetical protein
MSNAASISPRPSPTTTDARLELEVSRSRQTARPTPRFRDLLAGGADLLLSGAEVATHVAAGPVLAATVHDARATTVAALAARTGGPAPTAALGAPPGSSDPAGVTAMIQEGQLSNTQLLVLQQQIQQENQQFSTLSNVMRARHDTAKAAVSNIRA